MSVIVQAKPPARSKVEQAARELRVKSMKHNAAALKAHPGMRDAGTWKHALSLMQRVHAANEASSYPSGAERSGVSRVSPAEAQGKNLSEAALADIAAENFYRAYCEATGVPYREAVR